MSQDWKTASYIRASEIGDYIYCNRQWYLKRVEGVRPASFQLERMKKGTQFHSEHWQEVRKVARNEKVILALIAAAVTMFVLFLLITFA